MRLGAARRRIGGVLAWLVMGASCLGLAALRTVWAAASGCTLHLKSSPAEDARCEAGGDGCYICEYYNQNDGFTTCSEYPDGTIPFPCIPGLHAFDQYSGSRWAPPAAPLPWEQGGERASRPPASPGIATP